MTGHGKFKLVFSEETSSVSPCEDEKVWRQLERKENIIFQFVLFLVTRM